MESENIVVSAVRPCEDGSLLVRVYETTGKRGRAVLTFGKEILQAYAVDSLENVFPDKTEVSGKSVILEAEAWSIAAVRVRLAE